MIFIQEDSGDPYYCSWLLWPTSKKSVLKKKKEVVIKHQHIKNEKHLIILHV